MSQRVLIVGATSAIAAAVARLYAAAGDQLFLMGRSPDKLSALVEELGPAVQGHLTGDFDELEQNASRLAHAVDVLGGLDVVLIAHGRLGNQRQSEEELLEALATIQTNFTSAVSFLIPIANLFEAQGAGRIAVITSVAGDRGRPRNYTYGAAKGGLTHYLEGMRTRLSRHGVAVHNLKLGPVDTPMTADHEKSAVFASAPAAARSIFRAMHSKRFEVFVPWFWRWIMMAVRWMPHWLYARIGFLSGR